MSFTAPTPCPEKCPTWSTSYDWTTPNILLDELPLATARESFGQRQAAWWDSWHVVAWVPELDWKNWENHAHLGLEISGARVLWFWNSAVQLPWIWVLENSQGYFPKASKLSCTANIGFSVVVLRFRCTIRSLKWQTMFTSFWYWMPDFLWKILGQKPQQRFSHLQTLKKKTHHS